MAQRWLRAVLTASALLPLAATAAFAGPNGASVVGGAATVQGQGTANVVVNQSTQNAIINWQTFNIGAGQTTQIYMPNAGSTQLDRVTGGQGPSQILGTLTSNGKVFLVNPDGILFGMGARINVGSLVATTNDIANADFMAGRYNFSIPGNPNASIVNLGTITAQTGGFAALVAPGVRNTGTITARLGTIALASGNAFTLDMYGDNLITLGLSDQISSQVIDVATGKPLKSLVSNAGTLKANGGTVVLTAVAARKIVDSVINNSGVIEADTIGSHKGMIVLGGPTATSQYARARKPSVKVSGTLSAAGKRNGTSGGTIQITGANIQVAGATIDASGQTGGGTVLIGGDWGGGHPSPSLAAGNASAVLQPYGVPNANTVSIDAATTIDASATQTGNGGKVIVWANQATTFLGTILAQGGAQAGNGGFVETSGGSLSFNGTVNTAAPNGITGTWLLDPTNLTIDAAAASTIDTNLVNTNVTLVTNADGTTSGPGTPSSGAGDIIVASALSWSSSHTLTLDAYHDIQIDNVAITNSGAGSLVLHADATGTGAGAVSFEGDLGRVNFSASTGTVTIFYNPADNPQGSTVNPTSYTSPFNYASKILTNGGVADQLAAYMLVNTVNDLQNVQNNLSGAYALGTNIDASATANWASGAGFAPIGNSSTQFTGTFNGNGNTINGLTISSAASYVGLFGYIGSGGTVENFSLANADVKTDGSSSFVGSVAGGNGGDIVRVSSSGNVGNFTGNAAPDGVQAAYGGLVGLNAVGGSISESSSAATVSLVGPANSGWVDGGGLVGQNHATIVQSFSSGAVTGTNASPDSSYIGGLVGWNVSGQIVESYAVGAVTGSGSYVDVGALVGMNASTVTQSYAAGFVTGSTVSSSVGGLIGSNAGTVSNSYWDTTTTGQPIGSGSGSTSGMAGLTSALFQSGLPGGFDATVWGSNTGYNGGLPYLLWSVPAGSQVIAGYVFNDAGVTSAGSGISVAGLVNGASVGSATTGANGSYNIVLVPGTISASGSQVLAYTTGANAGAAYVQNATGSVENLNIYIGYLNETSGAANLSSITAGLATAIGGNTSVQTLINGLANRSINSTAASFAIDQSLSGATLLLSSAGTVTQSQPITATNLALSGNGGSFTLTNSANQIGTLAANAGGVTLTDSSNLSVGSAPGTGLSGVTAGTLVLTDSGMVSQVQPIAVTSLALLGSGSFTLTNSTNQIGTLAANAGSIALTDSTDLTIGSVAGAGLSGVTASTLMLTDAGGVNQTAPISITNLALSGGSFTLTNSANQIGTLAANSGSIALTDSADLTIGSVAGAGLSGVVATTLALADTGAVNQSAPISVTNLVLSGSGGGFTLTNPGNQIGTLAANTGSIALTDSTGLTIGAGGGLSGVTATTLALTDTGAVSQTEPMTVENLALSGSGGSFTLTNTANQIGTLAANTGSVSITDQTALNIGSVGLTSGVTASGALTLDVSGGITAPGAVSVGTFTLENGNWVQVNASLPSFAATDFVIGGGSFLRASGGDGSTASPFQIADVYGLQGIGSSAALLALNYALASNIDASGTANWNGGAGLAPIGSGTTNFDGTLNGAGHTISGLQITLNNVGSGDAGLFADIGTKGAVENLTLTDAALTVTANPTVANSYQAFGLLVGTNRGTISHVSVGGNVIATVDLTGNQQVVVGGLAGFSGNGGTITQSQSTVTVTAGSGSSSATAAIAVGGLVGDAGSVVGSTASGNVSVAGNAMAMAGGLAGMGEQTISTSSAAGNVSGGNNAILGGLVGYNAGAITSSNAAGAVTAGAGGTAGGLVGQNFGTLLGPTWTAAPSSCSASFACASGLVTVGASGQGGGLVGYNAGAISFAFATGNVTTSNSGGADSAELGGLVANNAGQISNSFASGGVSGGGSSSIGGLVGSNTATITASFATGNVNSGDASYIGGLVGLNTNATIIQSSATGVITTGDSSMAGGLVGYNFGGPINQSYATGPLTAGVDATVGGLVGLNSFSSTSAPASITNSYATGAVTTGGSGTAGGLVGYDLGASITEAYATGTVKVGANSIAGGLVGANFNCCDANGNPISGASISNSYATGKVMSSGVNVELGGLVGENDPQSVITNSQATGAVVSTANLSANASNCSDSSSCLYVDVGGFVGANYGTISGAVWSSAPSGCVAGGAFACAGGNVSVGQLGEGGGFAGYNEGIIKYAFATGAVIGAAGLPDTVAGNVFDNTTEIAGFVAENQGQISHSFATGAVGTAATTWLSAGGFAGTNKGTIDSSAASGTVTAGDNSTAGGFVSDNSPASSSQTASCAGCFTGDGYNNSAAITNSQASGDVTVGASGIAGGFAALGGGDQGQSGGSFGNISASGTVGAADNSIVGGLIGVLSEGGSLANSAAQNTLVASSGANSVIGGIVGVNEGSISNTTSTAPVTGTSDSYIGGVTGINLGTVTGSSTDPNIAGSGGDNYIGGIAGLNVGSINGSTGQVALTSGSPDYAGGVAGVNAAYAGTTTTIPNSSFPIGTITNSSATGSGFTSQVGTSTPSFIPGLPVWLSGCSDAACVTLTGGSVQQGTTPENPGSPANTVPPDTTFTSQQVLPFTQPASFTPTNVAPPVVDPSTVASAAAGTPGNPGNGAAGNGANGLNGNNGSSPNTGSLANGRQGGNGAPPGVRLVDMRVMPLPPGTGLPPPGETRFLPTQVVMQFGAGMTPQQVAVIAQRFGLTVVAQQTIGAFGRTVYTFQINNGRSVAAVIQAIDGAGLNAAAQPNYTYGLTQDRPGLAADLGDPAQYIVSKLQLGTVHRITQGKDVVVAVIDSRIDTRQPDFAGRIVDSYDAGCGPEAPPDAHGTGMAGAIASHIGLLGVAPNARIIAICAFGGTGKPEATSAKIIRGVDYAIAHGAKIINMSFAGPRDPALAQELQVAREKGILIIAAAGNAGPRSPPLYPGADPNVMAVTATDEHDRLFTGANQGSYVTVAAPGVNILVPAPNGDVQFTTGTSVASANVSGVAALLLAENPARTPDEVRAILVDTAKHLGPKGVNAQFGAGLVDPLKALRFVPPALGRDSTAGSSLRLH